MLKQTIFGADNEFNHLIGIGFGLVLEGLGPMLYPKAWRKMIQAMTQLPDATLRRFGGGLVVAGCVIYYMLRSHMGS